MIPVRTFGLFCCALLLLIAPARSTAHVSFDGEWWSGLNQRDKLVAVQGMLAGYEEGYRFGVLTGTTEMVSGILDLVKKARVSEKVARDAERIYGAMQAGVESSEMTHYPLGDQTFAAIAATIDAIYRNHPNLAKVDVATFMMCATSPSGDCSSEEELLTQ